MDKKNQTIDYYTAHAHQFCKKFESHAFETIHSHWLHVLTLDKKLSMLDVGAGSGRDASWFAKRGHDVVAVEPSDGLRHMGKDIHRDLTIQWINDCLPGLPKIKKMARKFDLILLNAVWMHLPEKTRKKVFDDLIDLLHKNGTLVITLRHGSSPDQREMYPVSKAELNMFSKRKKSPLIFELKNEDLLGRPHVTWETLVFRNFQKEG